MQHEHRIECSADAAGDRGEILRLRFGDRTAQATLRFDRLSARLVATLAPRALDLIEIAAFVYVADAAIKRGSLTNSGMGEKWRRRLLLEIPVREPDLWSDRGVSDDLAALLSLLSDDVYNFAFTEKEAPDEPPSYLDLNPQAAFKADEAMLFSGGLDSFAGALEEILGRKHRVVLVSHHSSNTLHRAQSDLIREMEKLVGDRTLLHAPLSLQVRQGDNVEATHRSRSFLFASVCAVVACAFELDRVRFYENGVVSMTLPPSAQVVGGRATRSTHPQVLSRLSAFFSKIFDRHMSVDNPLFHRTKTEVVGTIRDLGAAPLIPMTRSCALVRDQTKQHPHCGLCSQCIDRRFATQAAGVADHDPIVDYKVDPVFGPRLKAPDREMALGYVEAARRYAIMSPQDFFMSYGEAQRALAYLDEPAASAARRIHDLHQRHGAAVIAALDGMLAAADASADPDSLASLVGAERPDSRERPASLGERQAEDRPGRDLTLTLSRRRKAAVLSTLGAIGNTDFEVIATLTEPFLESAGKGLASEDYPSLTSHKLSELWSVDEATVRRRISRLRNSLAKLAAARQRPALAVDELVENIPWRGYWLNPDRARVVVAD